MKESIANSMIFMIVIIFIAVLIGILVGSTAYSKAYKIKNRIIDMIVEHASFDGELQDEIDNMLGEVGYRVNTNLQNDCPAIEYTSRNGVERYEVVTAINTSSRYNYCIYAFDTNRGKYYGVRAYMYFDLPIVENIKIGIYGETKTIFDLSEEKEKKK